jgi:hypothetical protein
MSPPRHLRRIRQPVFSPDNIYRNRPPVDILGERDDSDVFGLRGNQRPGPSESNTGDVAVSTPEAQMFQNGGAKLINFPLSATVSSADAKEKIPGVSKVCEWHFRDLMHLPKETQEE